MDPYDEDEVSYPISPQLYIIHNFLQNSVDILEHCIQCRVLKYILMSPI